MNCLGPSDKVYIKRENGMIITNCYYSGHPLPFLQCGQLDADGRQYMNASTSSVQTNYTSKKPLVFMPIGRATKKIRCTAFHSKTGKKEQIRKVLVYCKYHGVLYCHFVLSYLVSKINI